MNYMPRILQEFDRVLEGFEQSGSVRRLMDGRIEQRHYASLLREIFHQARENPQIQALATTRFRGTQRDQVRMFLRHAVSEIGHDELALNDLRCLGYEVSHVPYERPLPSTVALVAFAFYQIQHLNPVGYLGYLFFLEFAATRCGGRVLAALDGIGVAADARSFLSEHTEVDVAHNKLMEAYVAELVCDEADAESVANALEVTAKLYADLLTQAFDRADGVGHRPESSDERGRACA